MDDLVTKLIHTLPGNLSPSGGHDGPAIIDSIQPLAFWRSFIGALKHQGQVAIIDPYWPDQWKREYTLIAREYFKDHHGSAILIPTGGTSGSPRFCVHTLQTLMAAATSFRKKFEPDGYRHAVNVLPSNHIGGIMPVFRSVACAGRACFCSYREPSCPEIDLSQASISLVPTQLTRMIESAHTINFLKRIGLILVGGASCPDPLLSKCRRLGLRLAPCYGSTETAAMVSVLHPGDFLEGARGVGTPLPGVSITIGDDQRIEICAPGIQHGYLPEKPDFTRAPFVSNDMGNIDAAGRLHILGRLDTLIITGGKKVMPEQVEEACWESGMVKDVKCSGAADPEWGERVELDVVFNNDSTASTNELKSFLIQRLPSYAIPRDIRSVNSIGRNLMGKVRQSG